VLLGPDGVSGIGACRQARLPAIPAPE